MTEIDWDWLAAAAAAIHDGTGVIPAVPEPAAVDRRYLDLRARVLDINELRNVTPPEPLIDGYLFRGQSRLAGRKTRPRKNIRRCRVGLLRRYRHAVARSPSHPRPGAVPDS